MLWVCWHFEIWKSGASKFAFSRLLSGAKGLDVASYNAVIIALEKVAWERSLDLLKAMDRVQVGQRAKVIFVFFSFHRRASKWGRNGGTGILAGGDRCQQSGRCHSRVQECREWQQAVALQLQVELRRLHDTLTHSALMGAYALNAMWEEAVFLLEDLSMKKAGLNGLQVSTCSVDGW